MSEEDNMEKKKTQRWWYWPVLTFFIIGTVFILRRHNEDMAYTTISGNIFGTTYKITFQGSESLESDCIASLTDVDMALSMFNPESNLSEINRRDTTRMSPLTAEVICLALEVSKATEGAFDITVAPLVNAWGFGYKSGELPDSTQVDSLLAHIGWRKIIVEDNILIKTDSLLSLDCSAIAKGFGVDCVAHTLAEHGVKNYLVEIGGEVVTHGVNAKGQPWRVGVSRPSEQPEEQSVMTVLSMEEGAMATSGNYRNFFLTEDGRKIAHTINPATGFPVQHSLLSATVFAPSCAMADAFATSFMVMGIDHAKEILAQHTELSAYLIYQEDGELKTWFSPGLESKIVDK